MVQITYLSADKVQQAPRECGIYAWSNLPNFNRANAEELWAKSQRPRKRLNDSEPCSLPQRCDREGNLKTDGEN